MHPAPPDEKLPLPVPPDPQATASGNPPIQLCANGASVLSQTAGEGIGDELQVLFPAHFQAIQICREAGLIPFPARQYRSYRTGISGGQTELSFAVHRT